MGIEMDTEADRNKLKIWLDGLEPFPFGFIVTRGGPEWPPVVQFKRGADRQQFSLIGPEGLFREAGERVEGERKQKWTSTDGQLDLTLLDEPTGGEPVCGDDRLQQFRLDLEEAAGNCGSTDPVIIIRTRPL